MKSNLRSGRSRKEEARELIERAQDLGIYLELAFGFVIAKRSSEADPLVAAILIEGLGKLLPEVRSILRQRPDPDRLEAIRRKGRMVPRVSRVRCRRND